METDTRSSKKVLIIDDEEKLRTLMARIISLEGFEVFQSGDLKEAQNRLDKTEIDVVLCDVKLPDGNGIDFVKNIKGKYPDTEIILLTAYGNIPDGVQAVKNGAFDYITKGDDNNKIVPLLHRALEKVTLSKKVKRLEQQLRNKHSFDTILGNSRNIRDVIELAKKVTASDTSVLLTGETGTGKEVFAQAIHQESNRRNHNFVAVNCSAFSKDLLENEMFGHKAGAFTGAIKDQKGLFEEADNGTIFLDEVGEMSLELQAKLLRVIEAGEFIKVGTNKPVKINVRLITATNRDLKKEIGAGNFREDLFYRISVFQINLPPLRERITDIEVLANHFLNTFSLKTNKKIRSISSDYIGLLKKHAWKGNIRELKNVIERSVIIEDGSELTAGSLPFEIAEPENQGEISAEGVLSSFNLSMMEKAHIRRVLAHTNGNKTETARLLNIAITTLYRKIEEYKLG